MGQLRQLWSSLTFGLNAQNLRALRRPLDRNGLRLKTLNFDDVQLQKSLKKTDQWRGGFFYELSCYKKQEISNLYKK
jgi:hypothetical protein